MQPAASDQGWLHFLLAEPQVLGVIAWLGLGITVAGFWIAIWQLWKIKGSSEAANASVRQLVAVVRTQERSAKITEALTQIRSAQERIKQASFEAAAAHLSNGWLAMISARELSDSSVERDQMSDYVLRIRTVFDVLDNPHGELRPTQQRTQRHYNDLSRIHSELSEMLIRLTTQLAGIGG